LCDLQNVAIDWTNVVRPRSHLWNSNIRYTLKDKAIALQIDNDVIEEAPDKVCTDIHRLMCQLFLIPGSLCKFSVS
jgi:hypothetical protein